MRINKICFKNLIYQSKFIYLKRLMFFNKLYEIIIKASEEVY